MWIKLILSVVSCFGFLQAAEDDTVRFQTDSNLAPVTLMPPDVQNDLIKTQDRIREADAVRGTEKTKGSPLDEFTNINSTTIIVEDMYSGSVNTIPVNAAAKKNHILFIQQLSIYKDVVLDNVVYHYGVAIRWTIKADVTKISGGITLPIIAANVQMRNSEATATFDVDGCSDEKVLKLVPLPRTFDVQAFADFNGALCDIRDQLNSCKLSPGIVLLPTESVKKALEDAAIAKKLAEGAANK